jgi:hypothetical protein
MVKYECDLCGQELNVNSIKGRYELIGKNNNSKVVSVCYASNATGPHLCCDCRDSLIDMLKNWNCGDMELLKMKWADMRA